MSDAPPSWQLFLGDGIAGAADDLLDLKPGAEGGAALGRQFAVGLQALLHVAVGLKPQAHAGGHRAAATCAQREGDRQGQEA